MAEIIVLKMLVCNCCLFDQKSEMNSPWGCLISLMTEGKELDGKEGSNWTAPFHFLSLNDDAHETFE